MNVSNSGSTGRRALVNLALFFGSLALLFSILELGFRALLSAPPTPDVSTPERVLRNEKGEALQVYQMTATGVRLRPNSRVIIHDHPLSHREVHFTTNSLGLRDDDEVGPKAPDEIRVLVLGDSITLGEDQERADTYPGRLQRELQQLVERRGLTPPKRVRVFNAGVGAIDAATELAILREKGLALQPDIVVWGLYLNDAFPSLTVQPSEWPLLVQHSYFLSFVARRLKLLLTEYGIAPNAAYRGVSSSPEKRRFLDSHEVAAGDWRTDPKAFNQLIAESFQDWGYAWSDGFWRKIEPLVRTVQELAAEHHFRLVLVLFPVRAQIEAADLHAEPQARFVQLAEALALPHLDVLPALRAKFREGGEPLLADHCHYTTAGHAFVAAELAKFMERNELSGF